MMPKHGISAILPLLITFFCLNLSQAQTDPHADHPMPNPLSQVLPTISGAPTTQPASLDNSGRPITSGKYEEYQSICRLNEYDTVKYYPNDLKKRRVDFLKEKISLKSENTIKLKLRLLKEYIDQDNRVSAKSLIDAFKNEKIPSFDSAILNALIVFSEKNYSSAITLLNKLLNENQKNVEVLHFLAEVYIKIENYYEASMIYEDLNKLTNNAYLIQLCENMILNSANADAEKICQQAANKFPDSPFPLVYEGISYREREEHKKAMLAFKKSISIKPTEMGHVCLAEGHYMKNDYAAAIEEFKKASTINSASIRAILGLAWTQLKLKNNTDALEAFKKACYINGKYESEIRKAAKALTVDKISDAKLFIQAAGTCGQ